MPYAEVARSPLLIFSFSVSSQTFAHISFSSTLHILRYIQFGRAVEVAFPCDLSTRGFGLNVVFSSLARAALIQESCLGQCSITWSVVDYICATSPIADRTLSHRTGQTRSHVWDDLDLGSRSRTEQTIRCFLQKRVGQITNDEMNSQAEDSGPLTQLIKS